jgi:hypothetical protein
VARPSGFCLGGDFSDPRRSVQIRGEGFDRPCVGYANVEGRFTIVARVRRYSLRASALECAKKAGSPTGLVPECYWE